METEGKSRPAPGQCWLATHVIVPLVLSCIFTKWKSTLAPCFMSREIVAWGHTTLDLYDLTGQSLKLGTSRMKMLWMEYMQMK